VKCENASDGEKQFSLKILTFLQITLLAFCMFTCLFKVYLTTLSIAQIVASNGRMFNSSAYFWPLFASRDWEKPLKTSVRTANFRTGIRIRHPGIGSRMATNSMAKFGSLPAETSQTKKNSGALVRQRTTPTERPPLVGEVIANFSG
jgi:hypothetical protein